MKCKLNGNEIESLFPCSSNCPLFGDCLVAHEKELEKRNKPTNADRIRAMSDEELAGFLTYYAHDGYMNPHCGWHKWLKQPAEEETR
ncbi:MAG: hypothetical protein ACI4TK_19405 [Agathobacter sp.]